jgi:hypothetical protein
MQALAELVCGFAGSKSPTSCLTLFRLEGLLNQLSPV